MNWGLAANHILLLVSGYWWTPMHCFGACHREPRNQKVWGMSKMDSKPLVALSHERVSLNVDNHASVAESCQGVWKTAEYKNRQEGSVVPKRRANAKCCHAVSLMCFATCSLGVPCHVSHRCPLIDFVRDIQDSCQIVNCHWPDCCQSWLMSCQKKGEVADASRWSKCKWVRMLWIVI